MRVHASNPMLVSGCVHIRHECMCREHADPPVRPSCAWLIGTCAYCADEQGHTACSLFSHTLLRQTTFTHACTHASPWPRACELAYTNLCMGFPSADMIIRAKAGTGRDVDLWHADTHCKITPSMSKISSVMTCANTALDQQPMNAIVLARLTSSDGLWIRPPS